MSVARLLVVVARLHVVTALSDTISQRLQKVRNQPLPAEADIPSMMTEETEPRTPSEPAVPEILRSEFPARSLNPHGGEVSEQSSVLGDDKAKLERTMVRSAQAASFESGSPDSLADEASETDAVQGEERPKLGRTAVVMTSSGEIETLPTKASLHHSDIEAHFVSSEGDIQPLDPTSLSALDKMQGDDKPKLEKSMVRSAQPASLESGSPDSLADEASETDAVQGEERPKLGRTAVVMTSSGEIETLPTKASLHHSDIEAHVVSSEGDIQPLDPTSLGALDDGDMMAIVSPLADAAVDRVATLKEDDVHNAEVVPVQTLVVTSPMPQTVAVVPVPETVQAQQPQTVVAQPQTIIKKDSESSSWSISGILIFGMLFTILVISSLALGIAMEISRRLQRSEKGHHETDKGGTFRQSGKKATTALKLRGFSNALTDGHSQQNYSDDADGVETHADKSHQRSNRRAKTATDLPRKLLLSRGSTTDLGEEKRRNSQESRAPSALAPENAPENRPAYEKDENNENIEF